MNSRLRHFWRLYRLEALIAVLVFVAVAPWMGNGLSNESPRVALAAALVEDRSVEITTYQEILFDDYSIKDGRFYSDKAPGTSLLFAPVYAVGKVFGLDVVDSTGEVKFVAKLMLSALPAAILAGLIARRTRDRGTKVSTAVALVLTFGTLLLPFSTVAFGHELAALLGFSATMAAFPARPRRSTAALSGALVGLAVVVEYPMAIVALVLLVAVATTDGRRLGWFVAGAVPFAVVLLSYHWVAFDNPFHTPYRYAAVFEGEFPGVGIGWPDSSVLAGTLIGERGLFVLTPVVLLAAIGFFLRHEGARSELRSSVVIVVAFAIVPSVWVDQAAGAIGGYSPGPRFVIPALPFLAIPLAQAFSKWPRVAIGASIISIATMTLATLTDPLAPDDQGTTALEHWVTRAFDGDFRQNVLVEALGPAGLAIHLTLVVIVGVLLFQAVRAADGRESLASASA